MVLLRSNTSLARDAIRAVVAAPSDGATQQQHQHEAAKAWARSKTATMPKLTTVASAFKSHRDLAVEEGRQSRLTGSSCGAFESGSGVGSGNVWSRVLRGGFRGLCS